MGFLIFLGGCVFVLSHRPTTRLGFQRLQDIFKLLLQFLLTKIFDVLRLPQGRHDLVLVIGFENQSLLQMTIIDTPITTIDGD